MSSTDRARKVDSLGHNSVDRERKIVWRDRFGWRVWWDSRISWWVTQADFGAGSDKARPISASDLTYRGPFIEYQRPIEDPAS